jgi:hypothetical protein
MRLLPERKRLVEPGAFTLVMKPALIAAPVAASYSPMSGTEFPVAT